MIGSRTLHALLVVSALTLGACSRRPEAASTTETRAATRPAEVGPRAEAPNPPACQLIDDGFGPKGTVPVRVDTVVTGLEVPWSIAFVPGSSARDMLVTERPGRIRLVRNGTLVPQPVATVPVSQKDESGLLGLALHPRFAEERSLFVYYTAQKGGREVNRIQRYRLDESGTTARPEAIVLDDIPAAKYHDGGRIRFGGDGMLYVGTGDSREPQLAADPNSVAGKILRIAPDGRVPSDNPFAGRPAILVGLRNVQAFDWLDDGRFVIADHGPSGELGRKGHDEISIARAGQDLGWPRTYRCDPSAGAVTPLLVWKEAAPPGGAVFYRGDRIAAWKNSLLVATLKSKHLHRVVFDTSFARVIHHEVYFEGEPPRGYGRLRDVVTGPDGAVYVTTSNCDDRGTCPADKDRILRINPH